MNHNDKSIRICKKANNRHTVNSPKAGYLWIPAVHRDSKLLHSDPAY